jgi:hypothetical protein
MLESISAFIAALKAATPQILLGVSIASAVLLFSSPGYLDSLGLRTIVDANRPLVGGLFLISVSVLLSQLLWFLRPYLSWPLRAYLQSREQERTLKELGPDEKAYLFRYIKEQRTTQYFRIDDGVAQGLVRKRVIFQSAAVGYMEDGWAFNLSDWARRDLSKSPELLDGAGALPDDLPGGASPY